MNTTPTMYQCIDTLSSWAANRVKLSDEFEAFCDCDFDFIEILILLENRSSLNLLDSTVVRRDFKTVNDFITWVISQPFVAENYIPFRCVKSKVVSFPKGEVVE